VALSAGNAEWGRSAEAALLEVEAVRALAGMLLPVDVEAIIASSTQPTAPSRWLAAHGIRSNVHVLALMYRGELCFWRDQAASDKGADRDAAAFNGADASWSEIGTESLQLYITAAEKCLKGRGWQTARARRLLAALQRRSVLGDLVGMIDANTGEAGCEDEDPKADAE
jgi:hypothetical protein